jgi:SulP family sulfate permease
VLGAIVVVGVAGLVKVPEMIRLRDVSWGQTFIAWSTALATILLSPRIDIAVLIGMLIAAVVHIYREASRIRIVADYTEPHLELHLGGVLFYASAGPLERALSDQVVANPGVERLSLDLARLGRIDHSGMLMLQNFVRDARDAGLEVQVTNIPGHARGIFERSGGV